MNISDLNEVGSGVQIYDPVVILRPEVVSIGDGSRIDSFVKIEGGQGVYIGKGVHIASFAHIGIGGGTVFIEDGAAFASGAKVISGSNSPEGVSMSASAPEEEQVVRKYVNHIGKNACVSTNAVVLPGVCLEEGAVLAAGAVATKDIPAYEIWAGVPAKKIGERQRPA